MRERERERWSLSADQFLYKLPALHKQSVTSSSAEHRTEKGKKKKKKSGVSHTLTPPRARAARTQTNTNKCSRSLVQWSEGRAEKKKKSPQKGYNVLLW